MGEYLYTNLKEVCNIRTGKLDANAMVENGDYPFFTCDANPFKIDTYAFDCECVLIGGNNANGNFPINYYNGKFNAYQRTYVITIKEGVNVSIKYIYYLLTKELKKLKRKSQGSLTKFLTLGILENIKIPILSEDEYNEIGKKLFLFDSKIEHNKVLCNNLEQYSQLHFHKWFIDFNFPDENGQPYKESGGETYELDGKTIPLGWSKGFLTSIANYENGLAMQNYRPKSDKFLPIVKIRELKQGTIDEESERCDINIKESVKIYDEDIIFSWSASLFIDVWNGGEAGLNQHLFKVTSNKYPKWFYYYWTKKHLNKFIQIASGKKTTMGHINRKHLEQAAVVIPKDNQFKIMNEIMEPLFGKITTLKKENLFLRKTRDLLIKKLI